MATVDIAVPCYNYGRFLRECVESIVSQDVTDLRVLVLDNASTDDSFEVAQELARGDARIAVHRHAKNIGSHANYNFGLDWAASDYFLLLDADDLLAPGALRRAVGLMQQDPGIGLTYGTELRLEFGPGVVPRYDTGDGDGWRVMTGEDFVRSQIEAGFCTVGSSTMIRRTSVQKAAGYYRPALRFYDDWELMLRMASFGKVAETGAVQAVRRLHPGAHSSFYYAQPVQDIIEREATFVSFFANEGKGFPQSAGLMRNLRRKLAAKTYWSGVSHILRGKTAVGWNLLKFAFSRRPLAALLPPVEHFLQMDHPFERLKDIVLETVTRRPHGRWLREREAMSVVFEPTENRPVQ
ncbi:MULTISPECIES: glycosyltransferase family A protein [Rhodomicrobium]|uniref:glycosyltransferase family 2 protein n=1 Tax=Rhodomicrobium TaxID=1068 RepID=UPI000B4AA8C7|nr:MULTISPECIES: glycosyltransferase family A protein [Rhodomicrobium]